MPSTLAWLDLDDAARRRMREIVGLFEEAGSLDELGLGRIRDVFSDRLFPGTSVLWRRARYLLFVPWIYQQLEAEGYRQARAEMAARALQKKLRNALKETDDTSGLIGLRQADPVSPPDVILWAALEQWGIRRAGVGSLAQYRSSLPRSPRKAHHESERTGLSGPWHPRLPPANAGFPEDSTFALRPDEAEFLCTLVLSGDELPGSLADRRADSLLGSMLRMDELIPTEYPWHQELDSEASDDLHSALHMSGCFSDVMHGAALLYVKCLALQRNENEEVLSKIDGALEDWAERVSTDRPNELRRWANSLDACFDWLRDRNPRISLSDQSFVVRWTKLALDDPKSIGESPGAAALVEEREVLVKGGKARLSTSEDHGDGGAVPRPLTYRWANAYSIVADIREGRGS